MPAPQNLAELNSTRKILDNQKNIAYANLNSDATCCMLRAKNVICVAIFRLMFIKMFWEKNLFLSLLMLLISQKGSHEEKNNDSH